MSWMNRHEIEQAISRSYVCPNMRRAVQLLYALMQAVDEQSDGWPYWRAPSRAAEKLQTLVQQHGGGFPVTQKPVTDEQLKKAVTPIRRMVTVQNKRQSSGFKFDVDAAMVLPEEKPASTTIEYLVKLTRDKDAGMPDPGCPVGRVMSDGGLYWKVEEVK